MVVFKFNPAETGLRKTLREYEEIALRYIWSLGDEGAGSGARARAEGLGTDLVMLDGFMWYVSKFHSEK